MTTARRVWRVVEYSPAIPYECIVPEEQRYAHHKESVYTPLLVTETLQDNNKQPLTIGFVKVKTTCDSIDITDTLCEIIVKNASRCDVILAPEYGFLPKGCPLHASDYKKYQKLFQEVSQGCSSLIIPGTFFWQDAGIARNTACAFSEGQLLCEYHKLRDAGDSDVARKARLTYVQGTQEAVFSWHDYTIGMEICADSAAIFYAREKACLDFLLLLSAGYPTVDLRALHHQRFALVNDGSYVYHNIIKKL